ncbi:MAG TPA: ABC transporter permease [Ignavibacteriaceae bacterium]|nr:ABC transporter permease [Ignavibacteriaceae bacterium]
MFNNYFKTALRSLIRNKSFAIINVMGLTIGIASCILLYSLISFEKSYDNFHKDKDRIYRVVSEIKNNDGVRYSPGVPFPVAGGLRNDFPNLEEVASIISADGLITVEDNLKDEKKFKEESSIYYAEPEFFEIFNFPWIIGNKKTALNKPNSAVLSQAYAEKYFGNWKDAVGKDIKLDNKYIYKIDGIFKNVPSNTDFPLQVIISYTSLNETSIGRNLDNWTSIWSNAYTFIKLPAGLKSAKFNEDLKAFNAKHKPAEYLNQGLMLQPLSTIHSDGRFGNYSNKIFSRGLIVALSLIALFLLLIACINFINLATAQAINRSREVGVRKVLGGNRIQLSAQFLTETAVITFLATALAYALAELVLPHLNNFLKTSAGLNLFRDSNIIKFVLGIAVVVTFLSGLYPAMILSGFNPIKVLKSKIISKPGKGINLRRGLVIFQFTIAQVLIVGTLVVVNQMDYSRNASLGFNKDSVLLVPVPSDSISILKMDALKNKLLQQPGVTNVSFSTFTPADDSRWGSDFKFDNSPERSTFGAELKWADADYFKTYDIRLAAGKFYSESDSVCEFVVNETFVKKLGIKDPEDILGKELNFWDGFLAAPIVGVVKDFHQSSFHQEQRPVVLSTWKEVYGLINIKLQTKQFKETLAGINRIWSDIYPEYLFEYQFLDEKIEDFYQKEEQLSVLYKIFAAIAIFISCLGLYGLVSFMAIQRTKEVGIRKVLGASASNIIYLFSKEFTILIGTAFLIAAPISYLIMQNWLEDFAFRIDISIWLFLIAVGSSLVFAWLTVGYNSIKAATANPVNSLKYE